MEIDPKTADAELRKRFTQALREDLAGATILLWKAQNALTEQTEIENLREIEAYVNQLHIALWVVVGFVARWVQIEEAALRAEKPTGPVPD